MLALGIDTSTPMVSVAMVADDPPRLVASRDRPAENRHGELLAGLVDEVLRESRKMIADVEAIGVGLGPGPFTGLRVGVVTAAAMGDALGVPVYGACSLDVVGVQHTAPEGSFLVVSDARRKQVYWALYSAFGARLEGPEIGFAADVAEHVRGRVTEVVGSAAEQFTDALDGCRVIPRRFPDAFWLAKFAWWQQRAEMSAEPLSPLYLRRPDAREPGPPKQVTPV